MTVCGPRALEISRDNGLTSVKVKTGVSLGGTTARDDHQRPERLPVCGARLHGIMQLFHKGQCAAAEAQPSLRSMRRGRRARLIVSAVFREQVHLVIAVVDFD